VGQLSQFSVFRSSGKEKFPNSDTVLVDAPVQSVSTVINTYEDASVVYATIFIKSQDYSAN
jgi:hypothetical protein